MYNRYKGRFAAADLNSNEMLDKAEWVLFQNPTKDETIKNTMMDMALKIVDTNGDGKLQKDEFLNDWHDKVISFCSCSKI